MGGENGKEFNIRHKSVLKQVLIASLLNNCFIYKRKIKTQRLFDIFYKQKYLSVICKRFFYYFSLT
jgi:hypothetical protein